MVKNVVTLHGMTRRRKIGIAIGTCCLVLIGLLMAIGPPRSSSPAAAPPPIAKHFRLDALGSPGREVSLSQYEGRPVLVNFFASYCAVCRKETPMLARFYRAHHGQVPIVGIDVSDTAAPALSLVRDAGVSYPIGADPMAVTASEYEVIALPQTFFLNADHRIVQRVFGAITPADLSTGLARMR
jgi:thiol-disulfide isomerase/thioredoxin